MTISLAAVFIPVLFMGGIVGRLLHEFSVTIGVAILVSGFVSISLTPMLCSRFLKPPHDQKHGWLYNAIEGVFDAWLNLYDWTLRLSLRFRGVTMAISCYCWWPMVSVRQASKRVSAQRGCRPVQVNTEAIQVSGSMTWSGTSW
jgi:HAE1 family hydrophobic/amphiphilic exporter-1